MTLYDELALYTHIIYPVIMANNNQIIYIGAIWYPTRLRHYHIIMSIEEASLN